MQIEAELDVGVRGGPQSERVHPLAHEPVKRADHRQYDGGPPPVVRPRPRGACLPACLTVAAQVQT